MRKEDITQKKRNAEDSNSLREKIVFANDEVMSHALALGNPTDVNKAIKWEANVIQRLQNLRPICSNSISIQNLFSIAIYYEHIGNTSSSLRVANLALGCAESGKSVIFQRRAHSLLCGLYARVGDYQSSFSHAGQAFEIARGSGDPCQIMATLSNTTVTLFSAGLKDEAKRLALKASRFPSGSQILDALHYINSSNGIKFSYESGDEDAADEFYAICTKYEFHQPRTTAIAQAHYSAFTAEHLVHKGAAGRAVTILESALKKAHECQNVRILALLHGALANSYLALNDLKKIANCERVLVELLPLTRELTFHHEELLHMLIRIASRRHTPDAKQQTAFYQRSLQEYVLANRHGRFFEAIARTYVKGDLTVDGLQDPTYQFPLWVKELWGDDAVNGQGLNAKRRSGTKGITESGLESKSFRRSPQYEIAEDWAVAAEFMNGGSWRHCFGVGGLSKILALRCSENPNKAEQIGFAARLHDIGKIATAEACYRQCGELPLNYDAVVGKHAEAGALLLSGSSDPVLQMAAKIARSHHEWWNGCGKPSGLQGQAIPIEARICAVADVFVTLTRDSGSRWSISDACLQISSMSGVQLDPSVVAALLEMFGASDAPSPDTVQVEQNNLLRTKKSLFEAIELNE